MPHIPLTKGRVALVDAADYNALLAAGRWHYSQAGYAVHRHITPAGAHQNWLMHRLIMSWATGQRLPRDLQVDHLNHDRLDNRRANLRLCTPSQNQWHKGLQGNNTSGYRGVSWNKGRWEARIRYHRRRINLGRYADPVTAALAYDTAARLLHQEFAGLNFPDIAPPPDLQADITRRLEAVSPFM
jgi:hypothetical protein